MECGVPNWTVDPFAPADTRLHYTPLLRHPEHPHYYIVQLQRLAMGGQDLPVDEVNKPSNKFPNL